MSEELKPCPFCGSRDVVLMRLSTMFRFVYCCNSCHATSGEYFFKEEAIKAWNRRHSPWHTGTPTESGLYLVCIRYNFKDYYTTAEYVEPYNPHTGWYNLKPPYNVNGKEWNKWKDLEVIAWQKKEPYKATREKK